MRPSIRMILIPHLLKLYLWIQIEEEEEGEGLEIRTYDKLKKKRTSGGSRKSLLLFYKYLEVTHSPFLLIFKSKPFYLVESIFFEVLFVKVNSFFENRIHFICISIFLF